MNFSSVAAYHFSYRAARVIGLKRKNDIILTQIIPFCKPAPVKNCAELPFYIPHIRIVTVLNSINQFSVTTSNYPYIFRPFESAFYFQAIYAAGDNIAHVINATKILCRKKIS